MMIPSDKLLPPPSILEKLVHHDPGAATWVMERTKEIGDIRREKEMEEIKQSSKNLDLKSLLKGLASIFDFHASSQTPVRESLFDGINKSWAVIGNDVRQAIRDYCDLHKDIAEKVEFTASELAALEDVEINERKVRERTQQAFEKAFT